MRRTMGLAAALFATIAIACASDDRSVEAPLTDCQRVAEAYEALSGLSERGQFRLVVVAVPPPPPVEPEPWQSETLPEGALEMLEEYEDVWCKE